MNQSQQAKFQAEISEAYQTLSAGDAKGAVIKFKRLLKRWPKQPQANHLLALAYKATGDAALAEKHFKASLAISNRQPEVHNNVANLYKAQQKFELAEQHYFQAIKQSPDYLEARKNLGLCFDAQGKYHEAVAQFELVIAKNSSDVMALTALANAERQLAKHDSAAMHYQQAIAANPNYANAWHNAGVNHHLSGDPERALAHYSKALELNPGSPEIVHSYAMTLHETGATDQAVQKLSQWLRQMPLDIAAHEALSELLWQSNQQADFGVNYMQAIESQPDILPLRTSFINQLLRAGLNEQASQQMQSAKRRFGSNPELLTLEGRLQAESGEYNLAYQNFTESLNLAFSDDAARQQIKLCLMTERYAPAQDLINSLSKANPDCQLSWAYQSLLWRLTDNDKYSWLCDYQQYVRSYQLQVPNGFANLTQFLEALKGKLLALHQTDNAPLQQTLRNGTQTAARLFYRTEPEIRALVDSLQIIVSSYIGDMRADMEHPLLRRKSDKFVFSGSWSVKLQANGFHVNHVHPAGWISSSCYISIPPSMSVDNQESQGAIKFGESPLELGKREVIEKTILPQPGMVVLFPSYMWHGTIPFSGGPEEFRLTSPFDIAPS